MQDKIQLTSDPPLREYIFQLGWSGIANRVDWVFVSILFLM